MKQSNKSLLFLGLALCLASLTGCGENAEGGEVIHLRVLNCEDYIGESEVYPFWEDPLKESYADVVTAFEAYEKEVLGKNVKVIYDTFDTNETMLSSLKTGKSTYDLICPSDYAIQKMMASGMLEPFDPAGTPVYDEYASNYLLSRMDGIYAENGDGSGTLHPISEYARGYMWGTLGILYNPAKLAKEKGLSEEEVMFDMTDWNTLWDKKYYGEMSIKDSMRDTYSVGIMKQYDEEIKGLMEGSGCFEEGTYELSDGCFEEALEKYNPHLTDIFNRCDQETAKKVGETLLELKGNVFGFEVDSGKDDIVKGLVGINLAWSGDAVYSLDRGENEANQEIYYSIPKTGGNIWFDGWVMPKGDSLHKEEAQEFVDFISNPAIAMSNMDTIGYTSFVAGDEILDLIRQWYDPRSYAMYVWHDASKDKDCTWEDSDFVYDEDGELVYQDGSGLHEDTGDDYGPFDMTGSTYEEAVVDGVSMSWEEYQELYNNSLETWAEEDEGLTPGSEEFDEYLGENGLEWDVVNLTYMFDGSLSDEYDTSTLGDTPDMNPYLFYTDERVYVEGYTDETAGIEFYAGRQFLAQYPPQELLPKLAVMNDYGANNKYVLDMWENVKSNNLPLWGVVVFGSILLVAGAFIAGAIVTRHTFKKIRSERVKAKNK